MVIPQRAIVRPRVFGPEGTVALPVEEVVAELLYRGGDRPIQIMGGPGSGKTTASRHLAATLFPVSRLVFLDDTTEAKFKESGYRVILASRKPVERDCDVLRLAPWTDDDLIEYLLATCPSRCGSVMQRLRDSTDKALIQGNPAVWRLTLDALAADAELPDIRAAIDRWLPVMFRNPEERRLAGLW
ncbi:MAG TPA: hypothetical protein VFV87_01160, partial [Pirellulaceae bacterium]|nr:hypothetical protein [Pirellulaceae bacterium]